MFVDESAESVAAFDFQRVAEGRWVARPPSSASLRCCSGAIFRHGGGLTMLRMMNRPMPEHEPHADDGTHSHSHSHKGRMVLCL